MGKSNKNIPSKAAKLRKSMTKLQQIHADLKYELDFCSFIGGVSKDRRRMVKGLMKSLKKEVKLSYKHIKAIEKAEAERSEWEKKKLIS